MLFSILTKSLSRKRKEEREREKDLKSLSELEKESERESEREFERELEVEREREKHAPWSPRFLASRGRFEGGRLPSQGRVSPGTLQASPAWSLRLAPQKAEGSSASQRTAPLLLSPPRADPTAPRQHHLGTF